MPESPQASTPADGGTTTPTPANAGTRGRPEVAPGMRAPLSALDVAAFVVELIALAVLTFWGFAAWPFAWNILAGLATPAVTILVWALFVSPRAVLNVHPFVRAVVELLVYASATIALWSLGFAWVGLVFAVIAVTVGLLKGRRRFA